jgi:hypothetical protein
LAGAPILLLRPQQTVFRAKYYLIRPGMTREQVHAIMGEPNTLIWLMNPVPSEEYQEEYGYPRYFHRGPYLYLPTEEQETAYVRFASGQVIRKNYERGESHEPTMLESIIEQLGW